MLLGRLAASRKWAVAAAVLGALLISDVMLYQNGKFMPASPEQTCPSLDLTMFPDSRLFLTKEV